jgi:hypothetical protein
MTGAVEDVWISAGVGVFVAALFLLALLVPRNPRPSKAADARWDDVRHRLEEVERKQNQADHDLRNVRMVVSGLATKDSVKALSMSVAEMRGEMKGLVSSAAATSRSVGRIEDFLLRSTAEAIVNAKGTEGRS